MGGMSYAQWALKEITDAYQMASAEDTSVDAAVAKILPQLREAQKAADEAVKSEDEMYKEILELREQIRELKERIDHPSSGGSST